MERRLQALQSEDFVPYLQDYALSESAKNTLRRYAIDTKNYEHFRGNLLQQILHAESIAIIDKVGMCRHKELSDLVIGFTDLGSSYNRAALTDKSSITFDVCWSILHCTKDAFCNGIIAGARNTIKTVVQTISNPKQAALDLAADIAHTAGAIIELIRRHPSEAMVITLYLIDPKLALIGVIHAIHHGIDLVNSLQNIGADIKEYLVEHPYESIEQGTTVLTESVLQFQFLKLLGMFFRLAHEPIYKKFIQLQEGVKALETEEIPAALALEMGERVILKQSQEIINAAEKIKQKAPGPISIKNFYGIAQEFIPIEKELPKLQVIFDYKHCVV
jgi:hypothetical protein